MSARKGDHAEGELDGQQNINFHRAVSFMKVVPLEEDLCYYCVGWLLFGQTWLIFDSFHAFRPSFLMLAVSDIWQYRVACVCFRSDSVTRVINNLFSCWNLKGDSMKSICILYSLFYLMCMILVYVTALSCTFVSIWLILNWRWMNSIVTLSLCKKHRNVLQIVSANAISATNRCDTSHKTCCGRN